jgi:hypothetical protein
LYTSSTIFTSSLLFFPLCALLITTKKEGNTDCRQNCPLSTNHCQVQFSDEEEADRSRSRSRVFIYQLKAMNIDLLCIQAFAIHANLQYKEQEMAGGQSVHHGIRCSSLTLKLQTLLSTTKHYLFWAHSNFGLDWIFALKNKLWKTT